LGGDALDLACLHRRFFGRFTGEELGGPHKRRSNERVTER
jgi:hypothetical protein